MGPNDPFASPELVDEPPAALVPASSRRATNPALLGFGVGVAFGLLALLTSVPQALAVLAFGAVGALVGLGVTAFRSLSLDFREAWRTLVGRAQVDPSPERRTP